MAAEPTPEVAVVAWPSRFPVAMRGKDGTLRTSNARIAEVAFGVAFLALRDDGAVTMEVVTTNALLEAGSRLRHGKAAFQVTGGRAARTHLVVTRTAADINPAGLAGQLFGKLTGAASVSDLVYHWFDAKYPEPADHVLWALKEIACEQGYYRAGMREGTGLLSRHLKAKRMLEPVVDRVASIEGTADAVGSRWQAFAEQEPDVHRQMLTDVAWGINRRLRLESDD